MDESKLQGKVVFKNYKSAMDNKQKVTDALADRVSKGKTIKLAGGCYCASIPSRLIGGKTMFVINAFYPRMEAVFTKCGGDAAIHFFVAEFRSTVPSVRLAHGYAHLKRACCHTRRHWNRQFE